MRGVPLREHILAERDNLATSARQAFLSAVFLLHQSGVDARRDRAHPGAHGWSRAGACSNG